MVYSETTILNKENKEKKEGMPPKRQKIICEVL
jgi:hypothetical protein